MISAKRIDRKLFLTLGLTTTSAWAIGCSDDAVDGPIGSSGSGGAGGTGTAGTGGTTSAGTFNSTSGSATGGSGSGGSAAGSGGSAAGSGGSAAGTGGSSAGSGGSGGSSSPAPNCGTQLKTVITANHEHVFNVTLPDVMAMAPKTYSTKGGSPHEHWVALTAADFAKLQAGGTVRKVSCNDGHEHEFIVNCLGIANPATTSGVANFCDAEHKCGDVETNVCPIIP